jgi:hypothetical protein
MKAVIQFYKVSFLVGAHVAAAVWAFLAVKLASEGHPGASLTFAILSGITTLILVIWWSSRSANWDT